MTSNKHMIIPYMKLGGIAKSRYLIKGGIHGNMPGDTALLELKHQQSWLRRGAGRVDADITGHL